MCTFEVSQTKLCMMLMGLRLLGTHSSGNAWTNNCSVESFERLKLFCGKGMIVNIYLYIYIIYAFEVKGCFVWSINASCTIYLFNELDLWLFTCPGFTHMLSIALESVTIPMPSLQRRVSSTRKVSADCWLDWIGGKKWELNAAQGCTANECENVIAETPICTHVMYKRTLFVFRSTIRVPSGITWSICWNHGVQKTLPVWDDWDPSLWLSYMRSILHVWCNT